MKNMYILGQVEEESPKENRKGVIRVVGWRQGENAQKLKKE